MSEENGVILLNAYTNKPETKVVLHPVFWCKICDVKLPTPCVVTQHMAGRPHNNKLNVLRGGLPNHTKEGGRVIPGATKSTLSHGQGSAGITCDVCKLTFNSVAVRDNHYKGKKHAANVSHSSNSNVTATNRATIKPLMSVAVPMPFGYGTQIGDSLEPMGGTETLEEDKPRGFALRCTLCKMSFNSETVAEGHFNGKKHKAKAGLLSDTDDVTGNRKRPGNPENGDDIEGSEEKKRKDSTSVDGIGETSKTSGSSEEPTKTIPCEDCGIELTNDFMAKQHFSGKRHLRQIEKNKSKEQNDVMSRWQSGDIGNASLNQQRGNKSGSQRGRGGGSFRGSMRGQNRGGQQGAFNGGQQGAFNGGQQGACDGVQQGAFDSGDIGAYNYTEGSHSNVRGRGWYNNRATGGRFGGGRGYNERNVETHPIEVVNSGSRFNPAFDDPMSEEQIYPSSYHSSVGNHNQFASGSNILMQRNTIQSTAQSTGDLSKIKHFKKTPALFIPNWSY